MDKTNMVDNKYYTEMWAELVTMPEGITNPKWNEVCERIENCASLACELRCQLEELAELMNDEDAYIGVTEDSWSCYDDVQDWADHISEIEDALWFDNTDDKPLHLDSKTLATLLDLEPCKEVYNPWELIGMTEQQWNAIGEE